MAARVLEGRNNSWDLVKALTYCILAGLSLGLQAGAKFYKNPPVGIYFALPARSDSSELAAQSNGIEESS